MIFKSAYTAAVNRLIGRWSPDALCLIGGVVEHRQFFLMTDVR